MATNKSKDAAALFELIDKSTLKVPKNAGQLKIPTWWSSKTNPPVEVQTVAEGTSEGGNADSVGEPSAATGPILDEKPPEAEAILPKAAAVEVVQHRLFDPFANPEASPTIRPPAENQGEIAAESDHKDEVPEVTAAAAVAAVPESPSESPSFAPPMPAAPVENPVQKEPSSAAPAPTAVRRMPPGVFAPQTMDRSTIARRNWVAQQKLKVSHLPLWALGAVAATLLILIFGVVLVLRGGGQKGTAGSANIPRAGLTPGNNRPRIEDTSTRNSGLAGAGVPVLDPRVGNGRAGTNDAANERARVYGAGEVSRSPDMVYLVISTSASEELARRNAEFLAAHDVSVSIEVKVLAKRPSDKKERRLYVIVAVQGFPKQNDAAEAFRRNVVAIGREHPDAKKTRKGAWDDAIYAHVTPRAN